jgi:hypothetical protein
MLNYAIDNSENLLYYLSKFRKSVAATLKGDLESGGRVILTSRRRKNE